MAAEDFINAHVPPSAPRGGNRVLGWAGRIGLKLIRWKVSGCFSDQPKFMVIVAPHTSMWDWIIGICALWGLRMKFSYLVKDSLFVGPVGAILRSTGGIPVNRSEPKGVVENATNAFRSAEKLYFAIAPEGTRKSVSRWKSGFLRIAHAADVPVVPVVLHHGLREIQIFEPLVLSGDIEADLDQVQAFYKQILG